MEFAAAFFSITLAPVVKAAIDKLLDVATFEWDSEIDKLIEEMETMGENVREVERFETRADETWKQKVMDIMYDVADLLDDIETAKSRSERYADFQWYSDFKFVLFGRNSFINTITDIVKRIPDVRKEIRWNYDRLRDENDNELIEKWTTGANSNSRIVREQFVGRREEINEIVEFLTSEDNNKKSISIVGMAGLGKSELAKMVWADERVKQRFGVMKWAHVSFREFNSKKVVAEIIGYRQASKTLENDLHTLEENLGGKTCLFVLDDIWDMDSNAWFNLLRELPKIGDGNKVLITTRYQQIAKLADRMIRLQPLSPEDCQSILEMRTKITLDANPLLSSHATKIIEKCEGVPLAVVTLASKLDKETDERKWSEVGNSAEWSLRPANAGNIMFRLKSSYDKLIPSYKSCFAYHTMCMSNDGIIGRERLKHMWAAQGFTKQTKEQTEKQAAFNELQNASFFPEANQPTFQVMSLFRDLTFLVANEYTYIVNPNAIPDSLNTRHVRVCPEDQTQNVEILKKLLEFKKLRTLVGLPEIEPLSKFQRLRVLDSRHSNARVLCNHIGTLNHLRYLDVSENQQLECLPPSIGKLINLETLRVNNCDELKKLPDEIKNLVNLKHLYISSRQEVLKLEGFQSLQTLELKGCTNLRTLRLVDLPKLKALCLSNCGNMRRIPECFQHLELTRLDIDDCHHLTARCNWGQPDWTKIQRAEEIYLNNQRIKPVPSPNTEHHQLNQSSQTDAECSTQSSDERGGEQTRVTEGEEENENHAMENREENTVPSNTNGPNESLYPAPPVSDGVLQAT